MSDTAFLIKLSTLGLMIGLSSLWLPIGLVIAFVVPYYADKARHE